MAGIIYTLGIDVGTTSIKGILLNHEGNAIADACREYSLEFGPGNTCELDAEIYWTFTCSLIRELIDCSKTDPNDITGLAFSCQGETLIVTDDMGRPLRKAMVWLDNRSDKEAAEIQARFGNRLIHESTGQPEVVPTWPATKIRWLQKNEPGIFHAARHFLLVADYLIFRLTGGYHTEYSMVSSSLYFNIRQRTWWKEMLDFLNISESQLPGLHPSGTPVGKITPEAAAATGLSVETQCITGAYDHAAGAIGAGNMQTGDITVTIGTAMAMCVPLEQPMTPMDFSIPCQCHAADDLYFLLPYGQTAGMVLRWYRDIFCRDEIIRAEEQGRDPFEIMDELAGMIKPGSDGLVMLPHLMGAGSPEFNPEARGVFAGIQSGMIKGHFIRAILESVVCMANRNILIMKNNGIPIREINLTGGGSRSHLWNQILADMTGLPVYTLMNSNVAALGAAMLAGTGNGMFKSLDEACKLTVRIHSHFLPDTGNAIVYAQTYEKYIQLYSGLESYWKS